MWGEGCLRHGAPASTATRSAQEEQKGLRLYMFDCNEGKQGVFEKLGHSQA